MIPYYDVDGITIYNADCADVLPLLDPDDVGLLLTDPPYGIDASATASRQVGSDVSKVAIAGDDEPFDPTHLLPYRRAIIWGANNFADQLPAAGCWIAWDKVTRNGLNLRLSEYEFAWTQGVGRRTVGYRHMWSGAFRDSERGYSVHPTQKPAELMRWLVDRYSEPGDLILDPYMGSGPVAQACADFGRRYVGVELVEDYCRIAVERLSQQTLDLTGGTA